MSEGIGDVGDELLPRGEALRGAMRWMSERRREDPRIPRTRLIDEAALRFDLGPADVEYLLRSWDAP